MARWISPVRAGLVCARHLGNDGHVGLAIGERQAREKSRSQGPIRKRETRGLVLLLFLNFLVKLFEFLFDFCAVFGVRI